MHFVSLCLDGENAVMFILSEKKVTGIKQVAKAIKDNEADKVIIAKDAHKEVIAPIISACRKKEIELVFIETMKELGEMAQIDVGASVVAELKQL